MPAIEPAPVLVSVASDLTEEGEYGRRWLLVQDGEVRVAALDGTWGLDGPPHGTRSEDDLAEGRLILAPPPADISQGRPVCTVPLSSIRDCRVEPLVAAGALVAETVDGPRVVIRFSSALAVDFGLAARAIAALAKGEPISVDPRDLPHYCPSCGRRLQPDTRVCPYCLDRGAVLRRILQFAMPYRARMVLGASLMLIGSLLAVLPPKLYEVITNGLVSGMWPGILRRSGLSVGAMLGLAVAALFTLSIASTVVSAWQGRVGNWVGSKVMGEIRHTLWFGVQRLSLSYFDRAQTGQIMQRIQGDTQRMQQFLTDGLQYVVSQFLQILFALTMMLLTSWQLTLVVLIPAPALLAMSYLVWPKAVRLDRRLWQLFGRLNVVVSDVLSGVRVVKAFGQENREITHFDGVSERLVSQSVVTGNLWSTIFPVFSFISGLGSIFIWYVGGLLVFHHSIEFGAVVAISLYMGMLLGPLQWFSQLVNWMLTSLTSAERVFEILDTEPDVPETTEPEEVGRIQGHVTMSNVHFGYAPHLPVLRDINLEVQPGEMIGLVGQSGAGKSTLVNLICRLYDPDSGVIMVDGHDLRRIRITDLRSQFGVVLQDTFLFDGTVAENIAYARPGSSATEIMRAARIANAHEFIVKLVDGYDTRIGEGGTRLSGGERQRISIARAVLHDPRVLILDEATASVDTETERKIQEAIARLVHGRTTFAIAHRLSTLRNASRLVVLDKGKVVEVGTHEELLQLGGKYAKLVEAQRANAQFLGEVGIGA